MDSKCSEPRTQGLLHADDKEHLHSPQESTRAPIQGDGEEPMNKFNVYIVAIITAGVILVSAVLTTGFILHGSDNRGLFDYLMKNQVAR